MLSRSICKARNEKTPHRSAAHFIALNPFCIIQACRAQGAAFLNKKARELGKIYYTNLAEQRAERNSWRQLVIHPSG